MLYDSMIHVFQYEKYAWIEYTQQTNAEHFVLAQQCKSLKLATGEI